MRTWVNLKWQALRKLWRLRRGWPRMLRSWVFYLFHDEMEELILAVDCANPEHIKACTNKVKEIRWKRRVNYQIRAIQKSLGSKLSSEERKMMVDWIDPSAKTRKYNRP